MGSLVVLVMLLVPVTVGADAFDTARKALSLDVGRYDQGGVSLRGGVGLKAGFSPSTVTLFRSQGSAGGTGCGAADFAESMKEAFESVPDIVTNVGNALIQNMPLLVICYGAPSLCDLAKHWQALVNTLIQFKYARCEQMQSAMAYLGSRLAGGAQSQCLDYQVNSLKYPINTAMHNCLSTVAFLTAPDGSHVMNYNLIEDSLRHAGASPETLQVARALLGEVRVSAEGGRYGVNHQHAPSAMFARYEYYRQDADAQLQKALQQVRDTGRVDDATLGAISTPGQVIPRSSLDGLAAMPDGSVQRQAMLDKLSTAAALSHLTWECGEVREQLAATMDTNTKFTEGERRLLQQKLDGLERDLRQVVERVRVDREFMQPALEAIQQEYAHMQQTAVQAGFRAPSNAGMRFPFGTQTPAGYAQ